MNLEDGPTAATCISTNTMRHEHFHRVISTHFASDQQLFRITNCLLNNKLEHSCISHSQIGLSLSEMELPLMFVQIDHEHSEWHC